jgi:hypothetical protein
MRGHVHDTLAALYISTLQSTKLDKFMINRHSVYEEFKIYN